MRRSAGPAARSSGSTDCATAFITVAERDLLLPLSLTKRLVNHARPSDVTEGYAADWTIAQLREPAQRIADRIEALMMNPAGARVADGLASRRRATPGIPRSLPISMGPGRPTGARPSASRRNPFAAPRGRA